MTVAAVTHAEKTNHIGLTRSDYQGAKSTLCPGCGNLSLISQIMSACYELSIPPEQIIKVSGIGCSSKAPAYFLSRSHGFNSLHGRMPSVATGAVLANPTLCVIGLSGDGDSASIGMGQFKHAVYRNVPMVYIMANNGVYGLTKGQRSATAERRMEAGRDGRKLPPSLDLCMEAIVSGATFVARAFSGNVKQLLALLKAALVHKGMAFLDVISPCITYNNREDSRLSFAWAKKNEEPLHELTFISSRESSRGEEKNNGRKGIPLRDGSILQIGVNGNRRRHDPTNRGEALSLLEKARSAGRLLTGLLYFDPAQPSLVESYGCDPEVSLAELPEETLRPSRDALEDLNRSFA